MRNTLYAYWHTCMHTYRNLGNNLLPSLPPTNIYMHTDIHACKNRCMHTDIHACIHIGTWATTCCSHCLLLHSKVYRSWNICECMYARAYVYMYALYVGYIYTSVYIHTCMHVCMYVCMLSKAKSLPPTSFHGLPKPKLLWVHVCTCVCIYVCIVCWVHLCIYVYLYVCMYVVQSQGLYMHVCMYVCSPKPRFMSVYAYMCTRACPCIHTYPICICSITYA